MANVNANTKEVSKTNNIDYIIGLPPGNIESRTNEVMYNSMPIAKIYPGVPSFTEGLTLFQRVDAFTSEGKNSLSYSRLLEDHGFRLNQPKSQGCLTLAYLADSFPTDTFTNEYGENFLQKFTDVASEGAASLSQMMGARTAGQAVDKISGSLSRGGKFSQMIGQGIATANETIGDLTKGFFNTMPGGSGMNRSVNLASALAAGSRVDFPMVWKTSGFQPSYTMTIRLYNPHPGSEYSTNKYIIGPIAALLLLGIPISTDGVTYSWPFIHRIISPGIFDLDPAFISNITIIKGGDQQQISHKQKLTIVDVRIDFGSLFSSILAAKNLSRSRPTLKGYLEGMRGEKTGVKNFSTVAKSDNEAARLELASNIQSGTNIQKTKNQAASTEISEANIKNPPGRVSSSNTTISSTLQSVKGGFTG